MIKDISFQNCTRNVRTPCTLHLSFFSSYLGFYLCEAVQKHADKHLRIRCLLQALRLVENKQHEISLVDCIFMQRCYYDHYYDIALPYARRPIFGIVSTDIESKHIAEYFLNSARICSKCGDYEDCQPYVCLCFGHLFLFHCFSLSTCSPVFP